MIQAHSFKNIADKLSEPEFVLRFKDLSSLKLSKIFNISLKEIGSVETKGVIRLLTEFKWLYVILCTLEKNVLNKFTISFPLLTSL